LAELAALAADFFGRPPVRFVNPELFTRLLRPILLATLWGRRRFILRQGRIYRPYFQTRLLFDTASTEAFLRPAGIRPPRIKDYCERLFRYCLDSDWGRRARGAGDVF
jgi:hypothetical protein